MQSHLCRGVLRTTSISSQRGKLGMLSGTVPVELHGGSFFKCHSGEELGIRRICVMH